MAMTPGLTWFARIGAALEVEHRRRKIGAACLLSRARRHHDEKIKVLLWKRPPQADQAIARFIRPLVAISARLAAANAKVTPGPPRRPGLNIRRCGGGPVSECTRSMRGGLAVNRCQFLSAARLQFGCKELYCRSVSGIQNHRFVALQQPGELASVYGDGLACEARSPRLLVEDFAIGEYRDELALVLLDRQYGERW
jgi:hypothetical protein